MQTLTTNFISLPLAKYSYSAGVPANVQQFTWSHVAGDLLVVFDTFRGVENRSDSQWQMMKVIQGSCILETLPLQELVNQASQITEQMRLHHVELKAEQLPISALVKCPLLGIRYNLPDGKVRRIQIKFTSNKDYDIAIDHLLKLGLRITPSSLSQNASKSGSPSTVSGKPESGGPSYPPSGLVEISNRPLTAPLSHSQHRKLTSPSPECTQTMEECRRPHTAATSASDTSSDNTVKGNSYSQPASLPQHKQGHEVNPADRANAYSGLVTRQRNPQHATKMSTSNPLIPPEYFQHPAISAPLPVIYEEHMDESSRPPTSNTEIDVPWTGSSMGLPPRRELPFGRSSSPKVPSSDFDRPSSHLSSSAMRPLPLPSLTTLSGGPTPPLIRGLDLSPLPLPTFLANAAERGSPAPPSKSHSLERAHNDRRITSSSILDTSTQRQQSSTPISPPHHSEPAQNRVLSEITDNTNTSGSGNLAAYSMHSPEGRKDILNDFILKHLDDDNFVTLVEDLSTCWAYIGLGIE
ncbi:hypothetical protein CC78DRAFT_613954 [Lojkania enalia]|uniref:Uncharacterized protein n=1 Tax=Lojkania enalia TaxID=147567 RepID=A0A9P4KF24_9PLEO|nr:hypothetical protein CC78DRAFT_613954 [Didymosphaeria enalia]